MKKAITKSPKIKKTYTEVGYVKYNKADFLNYADGFNYSEDAKNNNLGGYKSDEEIKKAMKNWKLKDFQEFYGFVYKDNDNGGDSIVKPHKSLMAKTHGNR
jgi:hypothetical protein|tara:strand:+ start:3556 stop:3858 length:303 start_codon:yes stop_codon:yes gene_type:complete